MIDDCYQKQHRLNEAVDLDRFCKLRIISSDLVHSHSLKDLLRMYSGLGKKAHNGSKKNGLQPNLNMQTKIVKTEMTKNRQAGPFFSDQPGLSKESDPKDHEITYDLFAEFFGFSETYHEPRVVLLPVGPYLAHVYWELSSSDIDKVKSAMGKSFLQAQAVLRFYDITFINFDGINAHSYFDIEVKLQTHSSYVNLYSPEKSYCIDLGFRTREGEFFFIARSNIAETPRAWPSKKRGPANELFTLDNNEKGRRERTERSPWEVQKRPNLGYGQESKASLNPTKAEKNRRKEYDGKHEAAETRNIDRVTQAEDDKNNTNSEPEIDLSEMCENKWIPGISSK